MQDGIAHTRKWDITTSRWIWEPALTAGLTITGLIPEFVVIGPTEPPLLVHVIGSLFTATTEVPFDGAVVTSTYVSPTEITTTVTPATVLAPFTAVVTVREGATPGAGAEGFSYIATEDGLYQGRWQVAPTRPTSACSPRNPSGRGWRSPLIRWCPRLAPAALPGIGGVTITEGDHVVWTGTTFVVVTGPDAADYGTGLAVDRTQTPPLVNLTPAGDSPATLGGVYVIDRARNVTEGLELGIDGRLRVPLATPRLAGSIVEPEDDGKGYVRTTLAGVVMWVPPADPIGTDYGTGLTKDDTATPPIVHLQPAGDSAATLGGVDVVDRVRNMTEGLELGADGRLRVPPPPTACSVGCVSRRWTTRATCAPTRAASAPGAARRYAAAGVWHWFARRQHDATRNCEPATRWGQRGSAGRRVCRGPRSHRIERPGTRH